MPGSYACIIIKLKILYFFSFQEIHMHFGSDLIILTPLNKTGLYTVKYNDKDYAIHPLLPVPLNNKTLIFAYILDVDVEILVVEARKAGVKAIYDGKNIFLQVSITQIIKIKYFMYYFLVLTFILLQIKTIFFFMTNPLVYMTNISDGWTIQIIFFKEQEELNIFFNYSPFSMHSLCAEIFLIRLYYLYRRHTCKYII